MLKANILDAKTRLSEYIERAARGERVVICRHNRPVAELRAVDVARTEPRPTGPLPDRPGFDVPDAFFEPMTEDELALWDGESPEPSSSRYAPRRRDSSVAAARETAARRRKRGGRSR